MPTSLFLEIAAPRLSAGLKRSAVARVSVLLSASRASQAPAGRVAVCPLVLLPLDRLFVGVAAAHALGTAVDGGTAWSSRTTALEQGIEFLRGELEEGATRGDAIVELGAARTRRHRLATDRAAEALDSVMRMRGLEPPRAEAHTDLNRARLPIPPHPRGATV
jgi:hypothetical protein